MKLQSKQREGSKVRRIYDQAQTPLQRLLLSQARPVARHKELERVAQFLDPLRLLHQLEHLQKALWRHAVLPGAEQTTTVPEEPPGPAGDPSVVLPSLLNMVQKEHAKIRRPRDWLTRADPFEGLWDEITSWLVANPERTGVDIFQELLQCYPERFRSSQVCTLRRNLHKVRANLLVSFPGPWETEGIQNDLFVFPLQVKLPAGVS